MTTLFLDGFDKYGPIGEANPSAAALVVQGEWTSTGGSPTIVAGLSSQGQAIQFTAAASQQISKTLAASYSRLIGGFRFQCLGIGGGNPTNLIQFWTGVSNVCAIQALNSGTIQLQTGIFGSTAIATSSASISINSIHYLEWDITFGASSNYQLWLDGVSIMSGSTGNTGNGHTSANVINLGGNNTLESWICDDLYLFDSTTSFNNAVLNTNPQIITQYPTSDSQTQFSNVGNILGPAYSVTASTSAPGANELFMRKYTAPVNCVINSVSCIPEATSGGANFKAVIYSDSSGTPNSLLSSGTQVTGTTSGTSLTGNLVTPQTLSSATAYWIGFITDTSVALQETDTTTTGQKAANTYGSGAPGTAPSMTAGQNSWSLWGNCTGAATNWESVDVDPAVGDISSISSSTSGNEDLYGFPALPAAITAVYTVAVKGNIKLSSAGSRTVDLRTNSSGTDSAGSNGSQAPGTTYGWLGSFFDTDPNTSTTWTSAAVNAATSGPKVSS